MKIAQPCNQRLTIESGRQTKDLPQNDRKSHRSRRIGAGGNFEAASAAFLAEGDLGQAFTPGL